MRTGFSNLATRSVAVALNAIAPKDANGRPGAALSNSGKKAVIAKLLEVCDARDGASDGMIFNVTGCSLRPTDLQCAGAKVEGCLSAEQMAAIEKGFAGPKTSSGKQVYPGFFYDTGIAAQAGIPSLLNPGPTAKVFPSFRCKLWIDSQDYQLVKAHAELVEDIWMGVFLVRLSKGSRAVLEQIRVDGDVWLPLRVNAFFTARVGLPKMLYIEHEVIYSRGFHFQGVAETASRIGRR